MVRHTVKKRNEGNKNKNDIDNDDRQSQLSERIMVDNKNK